MPTYEYECKKCHKTFELYQSMKDDALTTCPEEQCCQETWGKGEVKRLIGTGAGIIFKGSGFYCTDYRSSHLSPSAPHPTPAPTTETKTEHKTETKAS